MLERNTMMTPRDLLDAAKNLEEIVGSPEALVKHREFVGDTVPSLLRQAAERLEKNAALLASYNYTTTPSAASYG